MTSYLNVDVNTPYSQDSERIFQAMAFRECPRGQTGRKALWLIVLSCIPLVQTAFQGIITILIYGWGISFLLSVISAPGRADEKTIRNTARVGGDVFDRITGVMTVLIGTYFLYLA